MMSIGPSAGNFGVVSGGPVGRVSSATPGNGLGMVSGGGAAAQMMSAYYNMGAQAAVADAMSGGFQTGVVGGPGRGTLNLQNNFQNNTSNSPTSAGTLGNIKRLSPTLKPF